MHIELRYIGIVFFASTLGDAGLLTTTICRCIAELAEHYVGHRVGEPSDHRLTERRTGADVVKLLVITEYRPTTFMCTVVD